MLSDYGVAQKQRLIYYDNNSVMNITKNVLQHSKTKHFDIKYYFIRKLVEEDTVEIAYIAK